MGNREATLEQELEAERGARRGLVNASVSLNSLLSLPELLAAIMRTATDLMNAETGMRFRQLILSRGSEEPARVIVERFLGRTVSSEAFFARIGG